MKLQLLTIAMALLNVLKGDPTSICGIKPDNRAQESHLQASIIMVN